MQNLTVILFVIYFDAIIIFFAVVCCFLQFGNEISKGDKADEKFLLFIKWNEDEHNSHQFDKDLMNM